VPPLLVELGVGIVLALLAFAGRYALTPLMGVVAPYAFVFAGVTIAALAAGWRSGLVTILAGQALIWLALLEPLRNVAPANSTPGGLIISTISQLIVLATIAFYQREVDIGAAEGEKRLALLDEALREIDHRTRNNYQTVLAMIELQARRASDTHVSEALNQVADRIQAVANAAKQLAVQSADLGVVRLRDHLCGLVQQIERGLSRKEILVECKVDDVTASVDKATSISGHVWITGKTGTVFELVVADDGRGIEATRREGHGGLGSKLVESFARQLSAEHEVMSSQKGTTHRLVIPELR
jgi:two-component system, sensor histidine kinase PdtaS